jgi:hypothetical protein
MQLSQHSDSLDIVQILLHTLDYRSWVYQAVFSYGIQKQNYKLVKFILRNTYKEIPEATWDQCFHYIKQQEETS